jgi:hypothetical protein
MTRKTRTNPSTVEKLTNTEQFTRQETKNDTQERKWLLITRMRTEKQGRVQNKVIFSLSLAWISSTNCGPIQISGISTQFARQYEQILCSSIKNQRQMPAKLISRNHENGKKAIECCAARSAENCTPNVCTSVDIARFGGGVQLFNLKGKMNVGRSDKSRDPPEIILVLIYSWLHAITKNALGILVIF